MKKTKIFAAYLPQFHETTENNRFWGKGYTDWVAVKKAMPLFVNHKQPKTPINDNYYDLSDENSIVWQSNLAKKYGIDGFNIYHYWFKDGVQALQTPAELLLGHKEIDIDYFFTWDNSSWVRSWSNISGNSWAPSFEGTPTDSPYLLEFVYGDENQWNKHFKYLLPFFLDERYLKINNRPVFAFFSIVHPEIENMVSYWGNLAKEAGFDGVYIITQRGWPFKGKTIDAQFAYQPTYSVWRKKRILPKLLKKYLGYAPDNDKPFLYGYEKSWQKVLRDNRKLLKKNFVSCCFVNYDDTPRRGKNGKVIVGGTPDIFRKYFKKLYGMNCQHDKEFMLITAWNEWGEGAYLEPDKDNQYEYLEAIRSVVNSAVTH